MHQSKLVELLKVLSATQLRRCKQLVPALMAKKQPELQQLFAFIVSFAPTYTDPALGKDILAKRLNIPLRKLPRRQNELLGILEEWLMMEGAVQDPLASQLRLLEAYAALNLPKHYQHSVRRMERLLADYPFHDFKWLMYDYEYKSHKERVEADYRREFSDKLQAASDALDRSYLAQKLRFLLEMANERQTLDAPYRMELTDVVRAASKDSAFSADPLIQLYASALNLTEHLEEDAHFFKLREKLIQYEDSLPPMILKHLYTYLLNHCTRRITRQLDTSYYEHFLSLNEYLIAKELLLEEGQLAPWRYSNLITVGLRTQRLVWARQFLEKYKDLLPTDFRDNTYHYNLAHCLYYEKDYTAAQLLLNQLELSDFLLAVAAKNLLTKIYFETGETELLLRFLEAYRLYIYRQPLAKPKLKTQLNQFITVVRKLAKLPVYSRKERQQIKESLPMPGEILERDWLVAQLEK